MANPTHHRHRVLPTIAARDRCDDRPMDLSVLLVDDDPTFLSLAERILAGMGAEVVATADHPAGALEAANATRPDAVVVDVGLADREGIDLAYQLAALPWSPRVVLVSTDSDAGCAVDARDGRPKLPFIPKDEFANGRLHRILTAS
jgi:DNA-binding NarL/FixJ family response regulator